ncbi:hypothetical protein DFA_06821 [Cavenderia fasciculata]|uniref:Uncharacterized protein n=1 Tax=Cavenderia fasciculata TaxID=261658 RepID=F4Q2D4_CACFS|nr:uncharacterized protein DFA_06821 [Cavenderia fasciculata]EGG18154.1 hypothetical protein DFA_06821 [Cavenderia fasciculata]|eukprot:XP_004366195.1 hypothetical protein DFA_06821 [Cavenderia fasciculata]
MANNKLLLARSQDYYLPFTKFSITRQETARDRVLSFEIDLDRHEIIVSSDEGEYLEIGIPETTYHEIAQTILSIDQETTNVRPDDYFCQSSNPTLSMTLTINPHAQNQHHQQQQESTQNQQQQQQSVQWDHPLCSNKPHFIDAIEALIDQI